MLEAPFTRQQALDVGITPAQMRHPRWTSRFRSVYEQPDADTDLVTICRALSLALPDDAVFSRLTAAALRGWWLPHRAPQRPIEVTVPPQRLLERKDVRCIRSVLSSGDVEEVAGLRVTTGLRTLQDLAAQWSLIDLVVMADSALRQGDCKSARWVLDNCVPGRRGVRTLRHALKLADPRSESAMETVLRMVIVIPGMPAPTPQAILRDEGGEWLARVDLLGADGRSVLEFDGANHDEPERHAEDTSRWRTLHRHGFQVYPYTKRDIFSGGLHIIDDYETALGLSPDPNRAQAWLREWEKSSFGVAAARLATAANLRLEPRLTRHPSPMPSEGFALSNWQNSQRKPFTRRKGGGRAAEHL